MLRALMATGFLLLASAAIAQSPPAPTSIVIVACRVDDLTGVAGRQDPSMAANGWQDLEWHVQAGEYECKRLVIANLEDAAQFAPNVPRDIVPLHPDFSDWAQCGHVGMALVPGWEEHNKGWAVAAIGCPVRITNGGPDGPTIGWKLPDCPDHLPGSTSQMRCNYDDSAI